MCTTKTTVLITPTGARREQINLCQRWMQNQTYTGKVTWVIVDDAYPRTIESIDRPGWEIIKVYPTPAWATGQNTQARNIATGINVALNNCKDIEAIFIIEDDDYYKPVYLEKMMLKFNGFDLIGEMRTVYYNVVTRRWVTNPNNVHSSLFQTAFTLKVINVFENSLWHKFIDCEFWRTSENKYLFSDGNLAIGMKGMPGRGGIGAGHKMARNMREDLRMDYLKSQIGKDYEYYQRYYRG
jgi:glycosyltransferase involved in cell wall biosynthesis